MRRTRAPGVSWAKPSPKTERRESAFLPRPFADPAARRQNDQPAGPDLFDAYLRSRAVAGAAELVFSERRDDVLPADAIQRSESEDGAEAAQESLRYLEEEVARAEKVRSYIASSFKEAEIRNGVHYYGQSGIDKLTGFFPRVKFGVSATGEYDAEIKGPTEIVDLINLFGAPTAAAKHKVDEEFFHGVQFRQFALEWVRQNGPLCAQTRLDFKELLYQHEVAAKTWLLGLPYTDAAKKEMKGEKAVYEKALKLEQEAKGQLPGGE